MELLGDLEEISIERGLLMRVLAVTQRLRALQREAEGLAQRLARSLIEGAEIIGNRAIVGRDPRERLARQPPSRFER